MGVRNNLHAWVEHYPITLSVNKSTRYKKAVKFPCNMLVKLHACTSCAFDYKSALKRLFGWKIGNDMHFTVLRSHRGCILILMS